MKHQTRSVNYTLKCINLAFLLDVNWIFLEDGKEEHDDLSDWYYRELKLHFVRVIFNAIWRTAKTDIIERFLAVQFGLNFLDPLLINR